MTYLPVPYLTCETLSLTGFSVSEKFGIFRVLYRIRTKKLGYEPKTYGNTHGVLRINRIFLE
jgi:hypothetical protein